MGTFNTIPHFKFWCQKVLPLVYDDSLSYMELLCKVINYLNHMIDDINAIPDYIRSLISEGELKPLLSELFDELREQIALANDAESKTATSDLDKGSLVWLEGKLYITTRDILAGDQYVESGEGVTGNIMGTTIELLIGNITGLQTSNKNDLVSAINSLKSTLETAISEEETARTNADTQLATDISNLSTSLQTAISEEATTRANADTQMSTAIDNLSTAVSNEATTRSQEDAHIFNAINKNLIGKKILVIGDSISSEENGNHSWVTDFRAKYTSYGTTVDNISKSGATFAGARGALTFHDIYAGKTGSDYDIIIIAMGINDYQQQFPIGMLSPTNTDSSTFNGALVANRNAMLADNPNARIYWVEPMKSNYELSHSLPADLYRMLIKCACDTFNWTFIPACCETPFLDLYSGQIDDWTDGIHPNASYCPVLANYIEYKLNNVGHNYLSYQRNKMDLTQFCSDVTTGFTLALEFDTNFNATITISNAGVSLTEASGMSICKVPSWLYPLYTKFGDSVINNVYHSPILLLDNGTLMIAPNHTGTGAIIGSIDVNLNLLVPKAYS